MNKVSVEAIRPSLQIPLPSNGVKFGVAKPLFQPHSLDLEKNKEYNVAFVVRNADWKEDDDNTSQVKFNKKRDVIFLWIAVDDGTYTFWGRFYFNGTLLCATAFVRGDMCDTRWEITQAPRQVLIEKVTHNG